MNRKISISPEIRQKPNADKKIKIIKNTEKKQAKIMIEPSKNSSKKIE